MKHTNQFTMWIILTSATLTVMAGAIIAPGLNQMRDGLGVDEAAAGRIITTHGLLIALFSPLMGNVIDKVGPKRPYVFGLVVFGLAGGAGLFVDSYWALIVSRAVLGVGAAAFFAAITVIIFGLYTGEERDQVMGWRASANSVGGIIWPLVGGALGQASWHLPFGVYLLGVIIGLLGLLAIPETGREKPPAENQGSIVEMFRGSPILFVIYGLLFLTNVLLYVNVAFLPQLLGRRGISNSFQISLFLTATTTAAGITAATYSRIRRRLSYRAIALIALALWAVGFSTVSAASSNLVTGAAVALFGVGQGMLMPAIMVWTGEAVPASFRGRAAAYLGTFGFIGQFLSPITFGAMVSSVGLDGIFLVAGAGCALVFLLLLVGYRPRGPADRP